MKVTIEFDITIDGRLSKPRAAKILFEKVSMGTITSEEVDGTDKWAIMIEGWELIKWEK